MINKSSIGIMSGFSESFEGSPSLRPVFNSMNFEENKIHSEGDGGCGRQTNEETSSLNKCCDARKLCWCKSPVDTSHNTKDFCLETTLHGLKYVGQPERHLSERIFWLLSFLIGCVAAVYLINDVWTKYYDNPIIVTFQPFETTIEQIPFPAVTICNMNKVLKSKAEEYVNRLKLAKENPERRWIDVFAKEIPLYHLDQICAASDSFSKMFNYSATKGIKYDSKAPILENATLLDFGVTSFHSFLVDFLSDTSQKCMDMLLLCVWQGEIRNCSDLFKPNDATEFGKCCTFNMVPQELLHRNLNDKQEDTKELAHLLNWSFDKVHGVWFDDNDDEAELADFFGWDLSEQSKVTEDNSKEIADWREWDIDKDGLLMSEDMEREFPRRQFRAGRSSGLSILLNPALSEYFCTDSDSEGFLLQTHLPIDAPHVRDFGMAIKPNSEAFISVNPEITMANPDIRDFGLEKRKCYFGGEFELAFYNDYTVTNCLDECVANVTYKMCNCTLFYMPRGDKRALCEPSQMPCTENVRRESLKRGIQKDCRFCYPTCTEVEYHSEVTSAPIQTKGNIWLNKHNETAKWAESNVSIVHIYFGQDSTYPKYRTVLFGLSDLIANTGGLMGLCLGFSALSLIEFIYFFTVRAWCRYRR